jgi:predicted HTH domain antitoxin
MKIIVDTNIVFSADLKLVLAIQLFEEGQLTLG